MPGKRMNSIKNKKVYYALRKKRGYSKAKSARIANSRPKKRRGKRKK